MIEVSILIPVFTLVEESRVEEQGVGHIESWINNWSKYK